MAVVPTAKFSMSRLHLFVIALSTIAIAIIGYFALDTQNNNRPVVFCADKDGDGDGRIDAQGLYTLQFDGSEKHVTFITQAQNKGGHYFFSAPPIVVSPNGRYVAYEDPDKNAYLVDLKTHEGKRLTSVDEEYLGIVWSDNGREVAIETSRSTSDLLGMSIPKSTWNIFDMGGSQVDQQTVQYYGNPFLSREKKPSPLGWQSRLSPDGTRTVLNRDDGGITITHPGDNDNIELIGNYFFVEWAPDSKQLLLWIIEDHERPSEAKVDWANLLSHGRKATLFLVNADGTGLTQISDIGEVNTYFQPTWSPDGKMIVYGSWLKDTDGDGIADEELPYDSLVAIDRDGSNRRELLDDTYNVTCLAW